MAGHRVVGDYVLTQKLGTGSFAVVWKGKHRHTGAEVAVKEIASDKLTRKLCENLTSEINILKNTNHPNIIRLYETITVSNQIYLVLEFCAGGDLGGYIDHHGKVSEGTARHFMQQLGAGLQVLRANKLIHRDLKPQNLLLSANNANAVLKIADFGFARSLPAEGMVETLCGSPLYMAPEILQSKRYDAKADLWSVGAILYQLVTGQPPFIGQNMCQLLQNIQKSTNLQFPKSAITELHPECIDLCRKLLRKDPVERLSFEEFFNHSFIAEPIRREAIHYSAEESLPFSGETRSFQDEPMPFVLDENPQSISASPTTHQAFHPNRLRVSGEIGTTKSSSERNVFFLQKGGSATCNTQISDTNFKPSKKVANEVLSLGAKYEHIGFPLSHSKGAIMDSMEVLEKEYVLVSIPVTSADTISFSASEPFTCVGHQLPCKNPQKVSMMSAALRKARSSGVVGSREAPDESSDAAVLPAHCLTRIHLLQKCADTIAALAHSKYIGGQFLEAFSTQLVCLAVWKEALRFSSGRADNFSKSGRHASGDSEGSKLSLLFLGIPEHNDCRVKALCSRVEQEFCSAVKQAEGFAPHVQSLDGMHIFCSLQLNGMDLLAWASVFAGDTEIPDAMDIIFQAALTAGKIAAVEEVMGNLANAAVAYTQAATMLYFLLVEAVSLPIIPRLVLGQSDKQRLQNYFEIIASRQSLCAVHKLNLQQ